MSTGLPLVIYAISCWAGVSFAYWAGWRARDRKKPPSESNGLPFNNTVDFAEAMRQLPDKDTAAAIRRRVSNAISRQRSKPPSHRFNRFTP